MGFGFPALEHFEPAAAHAAVEASGSERSVGMASGLYETAEPSRSGTAAVRVQWHAKLRYGRVRGSIVHAEQLPAEHATVCGRARQASRARAGIRRSRL